MSLESGYDHESLDLAVKLHLTLTTAVPEGGGRSDGLQRSLPTQIVQQHYGISRLD